MIRTAIILLALTAAGSVVTAEEAETTSQEPTPLPHFVRNKTPLPDLFLQSKREGRYFTGFPAIGWDPDTRLNFGAAAQIYDNGKKDSPFFRITPYRQLIQASAIFTTGRAVELIGYYDQPYFLDTPWRLRGEVMFLRNPFRNYFGIGEEGQQLVFPGTGQVFGDYLDYKEALKQQTNGETNERFDNYKSTSTILRVTAEYDLLGGYLRPLFGLQFGRYWIGDYTGTEVNGAIQQTTHLEEDCQSGQAIGCDGGWDNFVKLGIAYDTRDFEPNPNTGIFWESVAELSPKALGSAFNYGRLSTDLRAHGQIAHFKAHNFVLANRAYFGWQFGDVPFYSMNTLAYTDRDRTGLGGFRSVRGYKLDRFIGPVQIMNNLEIRWTFHDFTLFKQNFQLGIKPFFDIGRTFDDFADISLDGWKIGFGSGLTLIWNLATIINFDAAWSSEGRSIYMEVGTQF